MIDELLRFEINRTGSMPNEEPREMTRRNKKSHKLPVAGIGNCEIICWDSHPEIGISNAEPTTPVRPVQIFIPLRAAILRVVQLKIALERATAV